MLFFTLMVILGVIGANAQSVNNVKNVKIEECGFHYRWQYVSNDTIYTAWGNKHKLQELSLDNAKFLPFEVPRRWVNGWAYLIHGVLKVEDNKFIIYLDACKREKGGMINRNITDNEALLVDLTSGTTTTVEYDLDREGDVVRKFVEASVSKFNKLEYDENDNNITVWSDWSKVGLFVW